MVDIVYDLDLGLENINEDLHDSIKDEVGFALIDQIKLDMNNSTSSVDGKVWKKKIDGEASKLYEEGDLHAALEFKHSDSGIQIGWYDSSGESDKADGHNNHTGASS